MRKGVDCKGNIWEERHMSKQMQDLTGCRFTKLTALFPIYVEGRSKIMVIGFVSAIVEEKLLVA
jgi:hypothetical protein